MIRIPASSLARVMVCTGSRALSAQAPKADDNDANVEGTAAHHFAAEAFAGRLATLGDKAPNGWVYDAEMRDHVLSYVEQFQGQPGLSVETRVSWRNPAVTWEIGAQADLILWDADTKTLACPDFKYGFRFVSAEENWAAIAYLIGAAMHLGVRPERFVAAIYQPRCFGYEPLRYATYTPAEMQSFYTRITTQLDAVVAGSTALQTSPHCRYCRAAPYCPATQQASMNAIDVAMNGSELLPMNDHLRAELDLIDRAEEFIKQRKKWLEGAAVAELRNGKPVPGLSTKQQLGRTAWLPEVTLQTLRETGNNYVDEVPCSPTEAKRRGMTDAQYKALSHRPVIGVKLMREDITEQAAKVFGDKP